MRISDWSSDVCSSDLLASERYKPLLQLLSKELKQNVVVQSVDKYSTFAKGLADGKYDLAFVHPAHIGLYGVNHNGYEGIATAKGFTEYRAHIMVKKDSPLKTMADLRGKTIGVPAIETIPTTQKSVVAGKKVDEWVSM